MCLIVPGAGIPYTLQRLVMDCTVRGSNLGRDKDTYFKKTEETGSVSHTASCSVNIAFDVCCLCDRASLVQRCKQPTRCNNFFVY